MPCPRRFPWLCLLLLGGCEVTELTSPAPGQPEQAAQQPVKAAQETSPAIAQASLPPAASTIRRGALQFVEGMAAGEQQARSANQPLLVFFTATWCRYCHEMADDAFTDPRVAALASRFCCVLVDADADPQTVGTFGVRGFPTVVLLAPGGRELGRITGKQGAPQVAQAMQAALAVR